MLVPRPGMKSGENRATFHGTLAGDRPVIVTGRVYWSVPGARPVIVTGRVGGRTGPVM